MTDKDDELLADFLLQWEELRERGQDTPASVLCQDHPHLTDELARRIQALKVTSWMDNPLPTGDDAPGISSPTGEPRTLIGRYRLDNLIAEGGFAQVWRGYDLELQRIVAVKVPKPSRLQSADAFMAEARRVARLKHPGIVPVFDVGREGDFCFIVSEFVEGGSLGEHLVNSPPSQQQAIRWIIEIADALEYAHLHGVVHRDIKPANILIDHHNRALLADFGIAQSANKAGQQALSLGTLRYMSPEQLEGKVVDPRADIFSLGVVLHEALTGKLPYSSAEPNVLRREIVAGVKNVSAPDLPAVLRNICQKALQRDPQHRHTSAAHFAADLRRYLGTPGSSRWQWMGVFLLFMVLIGAATWAWVVNRPQPEIRFGDGPKIEVPTTAGAAKLPESDKPGHVITNSIGMKLAWIPPGSFLMGSPTDEKGRSPDESQHKVVLTKGFYMGVHEVTRKEFAEFIADSHYDTKDWKAKHLPQDENYPITCVNWNDASAFCLWLSRKEKVKYRLPTEAEWEYACRAGATTAYHFGPEITVLDVQYGKEDFCFNGSTIGRFAPNAWGLHDMHGNMYEWCADWYGPYPEGEVTDPQGPKDGERRVARGGCYSKDQFQVRSASRLGRPYALRGYDNGFRVVMEKPGDTLEGKTAAKALPADRLMLLAKQDFEQRFFERAIERFTEVIAQEPKNVEAYIMRGRCKTDSGDFKGGVADYTAAIDLDPTIAEVWFHRAYANGGLRQFDAAIADGEKALKLVPANPAAVKDLLARLYSNRAADHARANRFAEAAEDVTLAMKHDPNAAVFYHQRGSCYFNLKLYDKAATDFGVAIDREPTKASHYRNRGMCWQALGEEQKAAADFERAKKLEVK